MTLSSFSPVCIAVCVGCLGGRWRRQCQECGQALIPPVIIPLASLTLHTVCCISSTLLHISRYRFYIPPPDHNNHTSVQLRMTSVSSRLVQQSKMDAVHRVQLRLTTRGGKLIMRVFSLPRSRACRTLHCHLSYPVHSAYHSLHCTVTYCIQCIGHCNDMYCISQKCTFLYVISAKL